MRWTMLLLFFTFLLNSMTFGQIKFEREYRLKATEVPVLAKEYVKSLGATKKVKWYKEISQAGESIEAKTKIQNNCYSIEFGMVGNLEDVEVKIAWRDIEKAIQQKMLEYLDKEFNKHKIQKIQKQYAGNSEVIKRVLLGEELSQEYFIRFEMVVKGRKNGQVKLYELLFSDAAQLLESFTIELRNTDNLEY